MADQYDPKLSRAPGDRRQRGAVDDPLAELARIVQGRPAPSAPQPKAAPPAPPQNGGGVADLEAELLNDLQASFAAVRDVRPPPPEPAPQPAPRATQAAPRPQAPAPPVSLVEDDEEFVPPAIARPESRSGLRDEFRLEPIDETRLVPIPNPPVIQPLIQASAEPAPRAVFERRPEPAAERQPEPPADRSPSPPPRQPSPPVVPDLAAFQLRGSSSQAPTPPPPAAPAATTTAASRPHSRWERPEPARAQPAAPSRFAPPRTAAPTMPEEEELDPFAEGGLFADQLEAPEAEDDLELDDLGTLPPFADDEQLPPLEDDFDALPKRRGISRNLAVIGGVVLVALVGTVAFATLRGGSSGTGVPPVITADGSPTKITPDNTGDGTDSTGQNKQIYDRVTSGDQTNTDTTLLKPDSGPVQDVGSQSANNAISRVIIPGGPGFDAPSNADGQRVAPASNDAPAAGNDAVGELAANDAQASADASSIQPIGPKKVRTVVVKPDGTIVYSNAKDAGEADTTAPTATADGTTTASPPAPTNAPPPVTDDVAAIAGNNSDALSITAPADGATADAPAATEAPAAAKPANPPPAAAAKPAPAKPAKPAATDVATADDGSSPIDLVPDSAPSAAAGGVLVQISSQRSEDAARATYRDLQARYPNILGSYQVNVQRADVPDRGTFYRVRVGPFSQGDAQRLCDDLRQAGGDCVLAKR